MVGRDLLFQDVFHLMTWSTLNLFVGVKPGDSGEVICYQVEEFTHTWLTEHFIAQSDIYPSFMGKVSTPTHFLLSQGGRITPFLTQVVNDLEQGLDSILTDSVDTLRIDASFHKADTMPFFSPL